MTKWRYSTIEYRTEWNSWHCARNRCLNPQFPFYSNYGGRGITMDPHWACKETGFDNFMDDMGRKPEDKPTLERIDNDGPYSKANCKWESYANQNKNKRAPTGQRRNEPYAPLTARKRASKNRLITHAGRSLTLRQWVSETGITLEAIRYRMAAGWDMTAVLTTPLRKTRR